jgi:enoyl-CoA hydratase/carnithine racemase
MPTDHPEDNLVEVVHSHGVATLTLNRAKAANALNEGLQKALAHALRSANADAAVCAVVLQGNPRIFSAGADLREYAELPLPEARKRRREMLRDTMLAVIDFEKPLIACIHGKAVGAGCMVALLADELHAAPTAEFSMPEVRIGIPTPLGVTIAEERVGPRIARLLTLSMKPLSATTAESMHMVDQMHEADALHAAAVQRAAALGSTNLLTFAQTKKWLNRTVRAGVLEAVDETARLADLA